MNTNTKGQIIADYAQSLSFGRGNAKLGAEIVTFSLPAGYSCPGALACLARSDKETGKITDGKLARFRCFAASAEAAFPSVRQSRHANWEALKAAKSREAMAELILAWLPQSEVMRIHVSGDFFSEAYFGAWCDVARSRPATRFYAYTKSIPIVKKLAGQIPDNLRLTASEGGKFDAQIGSFKRAKVVFSQDEADALNLSVDHDDSHAYDGSESFALLLHGTQARGTPAAKSLSALRAQGLGGYSKTIPPRHAMTTI
jgi:Gene product 88